MAENGIESARGHGGPGRDARPLALSGIGVVCFCALLALAWMAVDTLLLIFSGVLLGVFLDGLTRALGLALPLPRGLRLTAVCLVLAAATAGLASVGGATGPLVQAMTPAVPRRPSGVDSVPYWTRPSSSCAARTGVPRTISGSSETSRVTSPTVVVLTPAPAASR